MLVLRVEWLPTGMTMAFGCGGWVGPDAAQRREEEGWEDTVDVQEDAGDARNA
jgi:hypothetical protein